MVEKLMGTVVQLNLERGYGFIHVPGSANTFFHRSSLMPPLEFEQMQGQRVTFERGPGEDGRMRAKYIRAAAN